MLQLRKQECLYAWFYPRKERHRRCLTVSVRALDDCTLISPMLTTFPYIGNHVLLSPRIYLGMLPSGPL